VPVGLREAREFVQRVAEAEVGHRIAGLEAREPEPQRLLALALAVDRGAEELPIDRALVAEQWPGSENDLACGDRLEAEHWGVEPGSRPDLAHLVVVRVELKWVFRPLFRAAVAGGSCGQLQSGMRLVGPRRPRL